MHHIAAVSMLAILTTGASAQEFTDTFSLPATPSSPVFGWTARAGTWSISNGRLKLDAGFGWSYITKDGLAARNCVLDMEAFLVGGNLQFAGLAARFASPSHTLMSKIQRNSATAIGFDRAYIYEQGGSSGGLWANTNNQVTSAFCRFIVCDDEAWLQLDLDKNGVYEQTIGPRSTTTVSGAGRIGVSAFSDSMIDNFEYFNAVLKPVPNAVPKIGTTYAMDLVTTATKVTPWQLGLSTGNTGFPIGRRRIPLDPDAVLELSLRTAGPLGLVGLTDAQGRARSTFVIPNLPSLVGVTLYCAGVTLDGSRPDGIDNISNELAITFQR